MRIEYTCNKCKKDVAVEFFYITGGCSDNHLGGYCYCDSPHVILTCPECSSEQMEYGW